MTEQHDLYPVRVDAALESPLSRWLWLVKWLLLVPHAIVLAFLWIAFVVLTVVAWFAILVTGRYPRPLFDFDVGVLRWSWRVHYYGYAALGTDRYPPFTLADVPDYPARLDVPYPERLSRGLVLVKSWLLAIPHLLVVALFAGGGTWLAGRQGPDDSWWAAGGLVGLLVLVAGVVLLFTGRYPEPVYDFVLGMDRWVLRVAAYVALMTDRYPPFRLDTGGTDPASAPGAPPPAPAAPSGRAAGWSAGRVVVVVAGAVLLLASTGLLAGGGGLAWADATQREGGYVWTPTEDLSTEQYALATTAITLDTAGEEWLVDDVLGDARLQVTAEDPSTELFLGVAPSRDVARYLDGVGRRVVAEVGPQGGDPGVEVRGGPPAQPPGDLDIWTAQAQGPGTQTLTWTPSDGAWTVVVLRADGSAGVDVAARAGITAPALPWLWAGLLVLGGLFLVAGVLLVAVAVQRAQAVPPGGVPPGGVPAPTGPPPGPAPAMPAPRPEPAPGSPAGTPAPGSER
ncbi:DUF4389 domain-containing protein [Geodermatophilus sp. SYSU D00708]